MKLHRFLVGNDVELTHKTWVHDEKLLHQWRRVLRFEVGREVVLFDGKGKDRLYKITKLDANEAGLEMVTELAPRAPRQEMYLLWSLLKKDKNDWVLQKCTELGISHFVPLLADRSEKTGFDVGRAQRIVNEAVEQCGRSDVPTVREPIGVAAAIEQLQDKATLYICEQETNDAKPGSTEVVGLLIGPEGGWSDAEKQLFADRGLKHIAVHDFTLRAETAAITAVSVTLGV
jgi:16S rRNA (uracil1498-N3)-methyltransferase